RKRNPVIAAAVAVAVIALGGGAGGSPGVCVWAREGAAAAAEAAPAPRTEKTAAGTARGAAPPPKKKGQAAPKTPATRGEKALDTLYATRINLAHREWLHGLSYSAREFLAQAPQARRGWEYDFLRGLFMPERATLRSSARPTFVSGSADGTLIATTPAGNA